MINKQTSVDQIIFKESDVIKHRIYRYCLKLFGLTLFRSSHEDNSEYCDEELQDDKRKIGFNKK